MKIRFLLFAIVMIMCFSVSASAEAIDFDKQGSIAITMQYNGETVNSGSFTVVKIADLYWNNGKYAFSYTEPFESCKLSFEKLDTKETAEEYAKFADDHDADGSKIPVGEYGAAVFTDLGTGLYLVIQEDAAEGYNNVDPFLITLPIKSEEGWVYEIDASPKVELVRSPEQPPESQDPDIPQTGQLKWPIPVLAVTGMVLFVIGWAMCFKSQKKTV